MMYQTDTKNCYTTVGGLNVTNGDHHEMISYENISYRYINDTRLASITGNGHSYSVNYDAFGRAVVRVMDGSTTYYIYDGEKPILEYRTWSSPSAKNVYGKDIDEILMRTEAGVNNGQPFYFQDDHEGSITHLTNASGNVIERYTYDAFGAPSIFLSTGQPINLSTVGNRFLFTGREYVANFGIYEYRNRAYHPVLGRFMSEDPKGFDAGDYNLFRYVGNDPLDRVDPMGLEADVYLVRDNYYVHAGESAETAARRAPGNYFIIENGRRVAGSSSRANEQGFHPNRRGVGDGEYTLQPKQVKGDWPIGQPAITGRGPGLKPGQPDRSWPEGSALVHRKGEFPAGVPDSKGCVTVSPTAERTTKEVMDRNLNNGGTHMHVTNGKAIDTGGHEVRKALPVTTSDYGSVDVNRPGDAATTPTAPTASSVDPGGGFARNLGLGGHNPRYFGPAQP